MYLKVKGFSYKGLSTTNTITMYKDTFIDGNSTTGNTIINGDLTVTSNLVYAGDDSYTNSEMYDLLNSKINTTGNTTINGDLTVTGNSAYNGDSSSDSYTKAEIYNKLFLKVNQSYGEIHSKLRINGGLEASVENPLCKTINNSYQLLDTRNISSTNSKQWVMDSIFTRGYNRYMANRN